MKILVAYFSVGSAHKREAESIAQYLQTHYDGVDVKLLDFVRDFNIFHFKQLPNLYDFILSNTFSTYLYDKVWHLKQNEKSPIYKAFIKSGTSLIEDLVKNFKPDVAITTHAGATNIIAAYNATPKGGRETFPLVGIITDFGTGNFWPVHGIDYYVTPSQAMKFFLIHKGFPSKKIADLGLPLHPEYLRKIDKSKMYRKYKLDPKKKIVQFVMSGAAGTVYARNIAKIIEILSMNHAIDSPVQFAIGTGKNRELYEQVKVLKFHKRHTARFLGFMTDREMVEIMNIADLIVSKSGGLIISEALATNTPLLLIEPFWGQEKENAVFLSYHQAAYVTGNSLDAIRFLNLFVSQSDLQQDMTENTKRLARPESTRQISDLLIKIAREK